MMIPEIVFNNKRSYGDFGVIMAPGKEIGFPAKEKIVIKPPFSNVSFDFSELYGSQVYSERILSYPFNILDKKSKVSMSAKKTAFINWLMSGIGKQKLYDNAFPGYYFLAEVQDESAFEENWQAGVLTVNFTAYPFMIAELKEGHDLWDDFNFELDVFQDVDFEVNGSKEIILINAGTPDINPIINASSQMTIKLRNTEFTIPQGKSKSNDFALKNGENKLTVTGNGSISFEFYKELI